MSRGHTVRRKLVIGHPAESGWRTSAALLCLAVLICAVALLSSRLRNFDLSSLLLGVALATLLVVLFFLSRFLLQARERERFATSALDNTEASLLESEERFRQMADNIQEIFWMMDASSRRNLYVSPAYETITGRTRASLKLEPLSYEDLIHPSDRERILAKLEDATRTGSLDERFRIITAHGEERWVWARGFAVRDDRGEIRRLVGTVLDITKQKHAEDEVSRNLILAESARSEADAMRKATLSLTQDLEMDKVLDTLLQTLQELIPCEWAQILLLESEMRLFLARETPRPLTANIAENNPITIDVKQFPLLQRALMNSGGLLLSDTQQDKQWRSPKGITPVRSWLCVPLIVSHFKLGVLSIGHSVPSSFNDEHLRLARLLAIPASAAIQNARLYQCAKIYGSELERRAQFQDATRALDRPHSDRAS